MSLHRVAQRLRREYEEHERGTHDGHAETARAHAVFATIAAEDLIAVQAAIAAADVLRELRAAASEAVDAATVYIGADDGNPRTLAERTEMRAAAESLCDLLIEIRRAEGTP